MSDEAQRSRPVGLCPDLPEIRRFLGLIVPQEGIVELRAFDTLELIQKTDAKTAGGNPFPFPIYVPKNRNPVYQRRGPTAGYFANMEAAALAAASLNLYGEASVYSTLQGLPNDLIARAKNRLVFKGKATGDGDVKAYRFFAIDIDAPHPDGCMATEEERAVAQEMCNCVTAYLRDIGFPDPIVIDSGNGRWLVYALEPLPVADRDIYQDALEALHSLFLTEKRTVDPAVANPSRLIPIAGTIKRKGDNCPDVGRPWRMVRLLEVPETFGERKISHDMLTALAAPSESPAPAHAQFQSSQASDDPHGPQRWHQWLLERGVPILNKIEKNYGTVYVLAECLVAGDAHRGKAHVAVFHSGAVQARCLHADCTWSWHDFRDRYEPGWREVARRCKDRRASTPGLDGEGIEEVSPPDPYVPFPVEFLPPSVRVFVEESAAAIGCDPSYVALPTLAALAAAIGNTRRIQLKLGWSEPSILWATCIGESGTLKSPALDLALRAVRDVQETKLREYKKALEEHETARLEYEKELSSWKKRKDGGEPPEKLDAPIADRVTISDITIEACACLLEKAPRGLLLARDELSSWVGSFDAFKQGKSDAGQWCELHRGGTLLVDRKSGERRTIYVPRASVSLTGGIQPRIMRHALGDEHRENGLLARLLLAMPPRKARRWTEAEVDPDLMLRMRGVFETLWAIPLELDAEGAPSPRDLPLTPKGKEVFICFVNEHGEEQVELEGNLASAWSKLEGYAARLALVLHHVRWADGDASVDPHAVDEVSVGAGVALARWFCREAKRVYTILLEDEQAQPLRQLLERLERLGGMVTAYELHHSSRRLFPTTEDAEKALQDLARLGRGRWEAAPPGQAGGRPTRRFVLNSVAKTHVDPEGNGGFGFSPAANSSENSPGEEVEWTE